MNSKQRFNLVVVFKLIFFELLEKKDLHISLSNINSLLGNTNLFIFLNI